MSAGEFAKLKFLKLDGLDVGILNPCDDLFPSLERVKATSGIPSSFGYIPKLHTIKVRWSTNSAKHSAREIQEEQLQTGNEELKVI